MAIKFKELAEFLDSDHTLDFIPDIIYPLDTQVRKSKVRWLQERLESAYKEFQKDPKPKAEEEEILDDTNSE